MSFEVITSRAVRPAQLAGFMSEPETVLYHGTEFQVSAPLHRPHVTIAHLKNIPGGLEATSTISRDQIKTAGDHLMVKTDRLSYVGQAVGRISLALLLDDSEGKLFDEAQALHAKLGREMGTFLPHVTIATFRWSGDDNPERPSSEALNHSLNRFIPPILRLDPARTFVRLEADDNDQTAEAV